MNWTKIKNKLEEWLWPRSTVVEELMQEIRQTSDQFKKELIQESHPRRVFYHYCARQGFKMKDGFVGIEVTYPDGKPIPLYLRSDSLRFNIKMDTGFDYDKLVIVSLCEF